MFHLFAYGKNLGLVTNSPLDAVPDDVLSINNNNLVLTNRFRLGAVFGYGANLSRLRFGNVGLTQLGQSHIWPLNASATVPNTPNIDDRLNDQLILPMDEEITIEATTTSATAANHHALLWLFPSNYSFNIPGGIDRFKTYATVTITASPALRWSPLSNITFERDLYNGAYAVVGCAVFSPNAQAFRLRFVDSGEYGGRQLRPGGLCQQSVNGNMFARQFGGLGVWGRFHTFSRPQLQVYNDTTGGTYTVLFDLVYLGRGRELVG